MRKLYILIFLILLIIGGGAALQQDFTEVEIKAEKVAGHVYMLTGRGGNIGVSVGEDGVLMVDDQFAPLSDKIKAAIHELGGDSPRFILNTHHHGDHTGGNAVFAQDGAIIAHRNVRKNLSDKPEAFWPVITFDQSLTIHMNGEDIRVMHYPNGHTDGDAVIFFPGSNVVHVGDQFFSGSFPYIDLNNGGSVQGFMKNTETILRDLPDDVKIIPGHGPLSTKTELQASLTMLKETTAIVREQMNAGKSLADIQAAGFPEKWQSWGTGFINNDRWAEIVFKSYSQEMTGK